MRMKNIDENSFRLIQIHCYDFIHWDSQQWWLKLFCNGDIYNVNNYNHEFVNTLNIRYSELKTTGTIKTRCKYPIEV